MSLTANELRLRQAAQAVLSEAPGHTSPGLREVAQNVSDSFSREQPGELSPGQRAVREQTGNIRANAPADNNDELSPGQRDAILLSGGN